MESLNPALYCVHPECIFRVTAFRRLCRQHWKRFRRAGCHFGLLVCDVKYFERIKGEKPQNFSFSLTQTFFLHTLWIVFMLVFNVMPMCRGFIKYHFTHCVKFTAFQRSSKGLVFPKINVGETTKVVTIKVIWKIKG